MASAGDVNGDGYGDVIVGRARDRAGVPGQREGDGGDGRVHAGGRAGGDALIVQGPGDVNGDGAPDVFVGGVLYLGTGNGFAPQASFTPGTSAPTSSATTTATG